MSPLPTSSVSCLPRYATRRRPERESFGPELAAIAEKLGQPFMPWQRLVADVGGEVDPVTGLPAYREVRVTVPRQSGKTTLFLAWQINRCVSKRWRHPQRSAFTAQTGKDARDKWIDELFPLIRNSKLKPLVSRKANRLEINEGMGNESIRFRTGSRIRLLSTSTTSGHSKTLHQAVMDEVWHDTDDRREQGLRPAMITVPDAQLLVCSTAGTDASVVLNRKIETGRVAVEADVGVGVAYFEWSAPEDWDPADEAGYVTFMPALCPAPPCRCAGPGETWRHTITSLDAIRAERDAMEPAEFKRAYGNVKTSNNTSAWQVIPKQAWRDRLDPQSRMDGRVALAVAMAPDRSFAAIGAAGRRGDGDRHAEVVDHRPGSGWVVPRVLQLRERNDVCAVAVGAFGHEASLIVELEEAGVEVFKMSASQAAAAFGAFYDGIVPPSVDEEPAVERPASTLDVDQAASDEVVLPRDRTPIWHLDQAPLLTALAGASTRDLSGGKTWDWRATDVDLSPVRAVTNAVYAFAATAGQAKQTVLEGALGV